ncbi:MAG: DPP IV N-terminal domain-containing protein [bacterium]
MKARLSVTLLLLIGAVVSVTASDAHARAKRGAILDGVESRLRAIYDRNEFRAKRLQANWLPDSSGYTVRESDPDKEKQVLVRYDVESGKRTVVESPQEGKSDNISPDGQHTVVSELGNLYVRHVDNGTKIQLTRTASERSVSNGRAVWSPDGNRIAFVQSDRSQVRQRSVLVPGDPSYPEIREVRFSRVGETIPTLRVGVVDAQGRATRWIALNEPTEGFYLGQVEWAGNSDELLIEKLSRFRNERELLLANVHTGAIKRIFHEADPAWVIASYGKNSGLMWIRDGEAFILLTEKDGWRHAYLYSRDASWHEQ